jgi:hypothetical protein
MGYNDAVVEQMFEGLPWMADGAPKPHKPE